MDEHTIPEALHLEANSYLNTGIVSSLLLGAGTALSVQSRDHNQLKNIIVSFLKC